MNPIDKLPVSADTPTVTRKMYTATEVMAQLKERKNGRTLTEIAREIGVSPQYISDVLYGRRRVTGPAILKYLGLEERFVESTKAA